MTWVLVMAMVVGGHLQFSEIGPYETKEKCEAGFARQLNLYHNAGVSLANLNGACYMADRG
ncbi:hypothetical protein [Mesorhizobium sp.]|uniref:hypothetical protein n=1 Tax=Mesorhizobium sp. TaxID=1871066 RepID=UPI001208DBB7|nr:hypothetical protein [Mesorhizobium sp.]TIX28882.1 MAG: hypothetical protein E5V35_00540 [Mesorhizobium sp.]